MSRTFMESWKDSLFLFHCQRKDSKGKLERDRSGGEAGQAFRPIPDQIPLPKTLDVLSIWSHQVPQSQGFTATMLQVHTRSPLTIGPTHHQSLLRTQPIPKPGCSSVHQATFLSEVFTVGLFSVLLGSPHSPSIISVYSFLCKLHLST